MCARVLVLLALFAGQAHSFSWDIVVGGYQTLEFLYDGTVTHKEVMPPGAHEITAVTYDPVHFRVLFADDDSGKLLIYSFDITTRKLQTLVMKQTGAFACLAYDPLTQLLFWTENGKIYSLSLKPASCNVAVDGNLIVTTEHHLYIAIAVDSCGGYVYWATEYKITRAAFDGSAREVLIDAFVFSRLSLAIDRQTEKMYWIEGTTYYNKYTIESADLNGKNRRTFYLTELPSAVDSLTVSKDFIYWWHLNILRLPKNQQRYVAPVVYSPPSSYCWPCQLIAANYTIEELTLGNKPCHALKSLKPDVEERHGSICHNYCFQGNYSVSAEGHPKCSCKAGYSGERCEVNACYMYCLNNGVCSVNEAGKPVCQCTAEYQGEICDVSICKEYCLHGNCSVSSEGQRTCSCNRGYSGERCEVNACHKHCFNDGVCSLNEAEEPVCQCTADYKGERCDVSICKDYCMKGNCSLSTEGQRTCRCDVGYSGERCEVNACYMYCLNNGVCSVNEAGKPVCQCTAEYQGKICDVSICKEYCLHGNCSVSSEGQRTCSCNRGYSGERCEVNACHKHCFNDGVCSLNEAEEPVCQCTADYKGERCDVSICKDYCMKGNCSLSTEGQRTCRCDVGYSGERCEVNACYMYCLNNGVCSVNEAGKPVCQCTAEYQGKICDVSICKEYCLHGNCSVSSEGQRTCSCNRGYSGERCEVNACHKHCFNDGVCSLNEAEEPVCQCTADYEGERCDVSICKNYCVKGNCSVSTEGQPTCRCNAGYSGERCEVYACHEYCSNDGVCSLNEEEEPVCQCTADYEGERCHVATTHTGACVCADNMTQQMLLDLRSEVKQVREDLQCTLQLYADKLDENEAKLQICEESRNDDQQNYYATMSKPQTSSIKF